MIQLKRSFLYFQKSCPFHKRKTIMICIVTQTMVKQFEWLYFDDAHAQSTFLAKYFSFHFHFLSGIGAFIKAVKI